MYQINCSRPVFDLRTNILYLIGIDFPVLKMKTKKLISFQINTNTGLVSLIIFKIKQLTSEDIL
jgi:hypothetical protein